MKLRHKDTGDLIVGTYDRVPCCAIASNFRLKDGELLWDLDGGSYMWWDSQETVTDPMTDEVYLVTENNDVVAFSECEFIDEEQS